MACCQLKFDLLYDPIMLNLQVVHTFLKDPLTDKLVRRYITSPRARKTFQTSVHIIEILMVAMPLLESAKEGVMEMVHSNKNKKKASANNRLPAHTMN